MFISFHQVFKCKKGFEGGVMDHERDAAREAFFAAAPNVVKNECCGKVEVITK